MECREGMDEETMIKPIVKDIFFLGQKSEAATKQDLPIGQDLQDTLNANRDRCVGMAANMIGVKKRIIIVNMGFMNIVMYNPVIVKILRTRQRKGACRWKVSGRRQDIRILKWNIWMEVGRNIVRIIRDG